MVFERLADESFCYLTTTGRVTGNSHTIEIWFALENGTLYMREGRRLSAWARDALPVAVSFPAP